MNAEALELEDAQARLLALVRPLPVEHVDVADTRGRYLAAPLVAFRTQPAAALSAMDGYAVRAGAGPWSVVGESAAGHPYAGILAPAEAVRIATGAVLPAGADAVIIQENCDRDGDVLTQTAGAAPEPGAHVRAAGIDFHQGDELLAAGTLIGPAQIALALAAGHKYLAVRRAPRIAVIETGDELAPPGTPADLHHLPASNGAMIAAQFAALPGHLAIIGPVGDTLEALAGALVEAEGADLVVTSGGASVGDHDLLQPALAAWGAEAVFWRVAIRPGKPLLVATRGAQIIIGLPGNPVSSYVTALLFALPVGRALLGATSPLPETLSAKLAAPLAAGGPRREFVRAVYRGGTVTAQSQQDSGTLLALAKSNALIYRAAHAPAATAGSEVRVYLIQNG